MKVRSLGHKAFTLIEILVVVALVAVISAIALPSITSYFKVSLDSAARELAATTKEAYHTALISGLVYRVVYDLEKDQYWVEFGPANTLLDTEESLEKLRERKKYSSKTEEDYEKEREKENNRFQMDEMITRKPRDLPRGVKFLNIENELSEEPITEGKAYSHVFPSGISEDTVVHLIDSAENKATLYTYPISGETKVLQGEIPRAKILKEL